MVDPENPKKCKDVNECLEFGHNCSQICTNTKGGYECSCRDGFRLSDAFSGVCRSTTEEESTKVLFSTGPEIHAQVTNQYYKVILDSRKSLTSLIKIDFLTLFSQSKAHDHCATTRL